MSQQEEKSIQLILIRLMQVTLRKMQASKKPKIKELNCENEDDK